MTGTKPPRGSGGTEDGSRTEVGRASTVQRLHHSNMAELISSALREKILAGELADGDLLPKQEDLAAQFGTSSLSVREGLRVLEGEGLVTVRRGRHGGSVVHAPGGGSVAYMLGLVFQARKVRLTEVASTLNDLEPICAGLCAERKDRKRTVVPRLRAVQTDIAKGRTVLEGAKLGRRFHEELVKGCGRETMVVLIGVLESIWTTHSEQAVEHGVLARVPPSKSYLASRHDDHEELIGLINDGDSEGAVLCARRHLESSALYKTGGKEAKRVIEADLLARYLS